MKLTFTLLAASLANSVSARTDQLCCCTKRSDTNPDYYGCHRAATEKVKNNSKDQFEWTAHTWLEYNGAPYSGADYLYDKKDGKIGAKEMAHYCKKEGAKTACWSPGDGWNFNYKGEKTG